MTTLLFQTTTKERMGIVVENNSVKEIMVERPEKNIRLGTILKGKVRNLDPGLNAAFIDVGVEKSGFLPENEYPIKEGSATFNSVLTEGKSVIVQVIKEAYQDKGPKLTANITIAGKGLIYLPYGNYIAFSKKLEQQTLSKLDPIFRDNLEDTEGVIIRTYAEKMEKDELLKELTYLRLKWKEMLESSKNEKKIKQLHQPKKLPEQLMNRYSSTRVDHVYIDDPEIANGLREIHPNLHGKIIFERNIEKLLPVSIDVLIDQMLTPIVTARKGVKLFFEQTEAMHVIDIDSSQYQTTKNKKSMIRSVNEIAAYAVADEIRKRNIAGIIIIDFITMRHTKDRKHIIECLKKAFSNDPTRIEIYGFTKLGLLEMSRKRESNSMLELFGDVKRNDKLKKNATSYVYSLERYLKQLQTRNIEAIGIKINPIVAHLFQENVLDFLKSAIYVDLYWKITDHVEGFEIIREGSTSLINDWLDENDGDIIDKIL